jgi:uncharacterized membrane protein YuzA (DUF378 family)
MIYPFYFIIIFYCFKPKNYAKILNNDIIIIIKIRFKMEDIIIYIIVGIAAIYFINKLFGKDGNCGCGGKGNCSKK